MDQSTTPPAHGPSLEDVRSFLRELHDKMAFFKPSPLTYKKEGGNSGAERQKNRNALSALGLRLPSERADWIWRLQPEDYTAGPEPDTYNYPPPGDGPLWQFGLWINNIEVYIKVQLGAPGTRPICISFHPVEKAPLRYPLRVPRRH